MKKKRDNMDNHVAQRALISILLAVGCFLLNRHIIPSEAPWSLLKLLLGASATAFCLVSVLKWISSILVRKEGKAGTDENLEERKPIKIWSHAELFAYLEQEDIIDLHIKHNGILKIGVMSELYSEKFEESYYFNKCYYIEDSEYTDAEEFKQQFICIHPEEPVVIVRASLDDGGVEIIL